MGSITRRSFLGRAGTLSAATALFRPGRGEAEPTTSWTGGELSNAAFRLLLSPETGLRKTRVLHIPSGLRLADGDYSYSFCRPEFHKSSISQGADGSILVALQGTTLEGQLEVLHEFHVPDNRPWIEEQITLTNHGPSPLDLQCGRCGFVLPLSLANAKVTGEWAEFKLTAVPYRREPHGHRGQYADFTLSEVLIEQYSSELWTNETTTTPGYAAEGWAWTDGKEGFLITKYSQKGMEWSVLDRVPVEGDRTGLRWGGYGIYRDNPQHGAWMLPGETHHFGVTRLTAYDGGMLEGFYMFRQEMAARGHGCPTDFDPPVHWNELYNLNNAQREASVGP